MNDKELLTALKKVGPEDRHRCLGCGYEHHCTTHGCAVTRAAAERIEALRTELDALRTRREPDQPLTLEELREMDGEPVHPCWPRPGCSRKSGTMPGSGGSSRDRCRKRVWQNEA